MSSAAGAAGGSHRVLVVACLVAAAAVAEALRGEELSAAVDAMRDSKHAKYTKSHKKFRFFDKDDSEFITRAEFEAGLKELGYKSSAKKLDHIMNELDLDQNGQVEFVEFMRPTAKKYKEELELEQGADTDRAFEHFDTNFDGQIDSAEFYEGLTHLPGMQEISKKDVQGFFLDFADIEGDGFLSYDELETIIPDQMRVQTA